LIDNNSNERSLYATNAFYLSGSKMIIDSQVFLDILEYCITQLILGLHHQ